MISNDLADLESLQPVQRLALSYAPFSSRAAFRALFFFDEQCARIVRARKEVVLAQIRIAWWRDMLNNPIGDWPQGNAILDALRIFRNPAEFAGLADGWEHLLSDSFTHAELDGYLQGRAGAFAALAREVGEGSEDGALDAAKIFILSDLIANLNDPDERSMALEFSRELAVPSRLPRSLRPLAVLAGLGRRALARGGLPLLDGPGSVFIALRIGLTGR